MTQIRINGFSRSYLDLSNVDTNNSKHMWRNGLQTGCWAGVEGIILERVSRPQGCHLDVGIPVADGISVERNDTLPRLCYLDAAHIRGPVDSFDHVGLKDRDDHDIGRLDGIIIDAAARRMRYFVVERGFLPRRRYLLPVFPTSIDAEDNVLRVDVGAADLSGCAPFDPASYRRYSDEDVLGALVHGRADTERLSSAQ